MNFMNTSAQHSHQWSPQHKPEGNPKNPGAQTLWDHNDVPYRPCLKKYNVMPSFLKNPRWVFKTETESEIETHLWLASRQLLLRKGSVNPTARKLGPGCWAVLSLFMVAFPDYWAGFQSTGWLPSFDWRPQSQQSLQNSVKRKITQDTSVGC